MHAIALDDETVLSGSVFETDHCATPGADVKSDQVGWPELPFFKFASLVDSDVGTPDLFGGDPVGNLDERDLVAPIGGPDVSNREGTVLDMDYRADLEVDQIGRVDVKPEETVKPVRFTEAGNHDPVRISRGTQPRR